MTQDQKVFDCVVVITDRQRAGPAVAGRDLPDRTCAGRGEGDRPGLKQLAAALIDGTKIVITTLQKFPFVLRGLLHAAGAESQEKATAEEKRAGKGVGGGNRQARYAVIVDEAHSSQTGETARELKAILGHRAQKCREQWRGRSRTGKTAEPGDAVARAAAQPELLRLHRHAQGQDAGAVWQTGASGKPEAFHIYSMRQAIEEGFILDVLTNYTTYATYYKLLKAVEDDPNLPKKKARAGAGQVHEPAPAQHRAEDRGDGGALPAKCARQLGGRAKAMVVTSRVCMPCATSWHSSATSRRTAIPTSARWWRSAAR